MRGYWTGTHQIWIIFLAFCRRLIYIKCLTNPVAQNPTVKQPQYLVTSGTF